MSTLRRLSRYGRALPRVNHTRSLAGTSQMHDALGPSKTMIDLGDGVINQIAFKHRNLIGPRTVVVSSLNSEAEETHTRRLCSIMRSAGLECSTFTMNERYPTVKTVDEGALIAKRVGAQSIVAIGGGGVIDLGKAISTMVCHQGTSKDYLRVFYKERELSDAALPVIAIPTTASNGCAFSRQSLVVYEAEEALVPMYAKDLSAKLVVVDPSLSSTVPRELAISMALSTLAIFLDAMITSSLDGSLTKGDKGGLKGPIFDGFKGVAQSLPTALQDKKSWKGLCEASVLAGRLLAYTNTPGPIQSLARCVAVLYPAATHSQIMSILLRAYLRMLENRLEEGESVPINERSLRETATLICQNPDAQLSHLLQWLDDYCQQAQLGLLSDYHEEDKTAESLAGQISNVLDLFEVERDQILEKEMVTEVLDFSLA